MVVLDRSLVRWFRGIPPNKPVAIYLAVLTVVLWYFSATGSQVGITYIDKYTFLSGEAMLTLFGVATVLMWRATKFIYVLLSVSVIVFYAGAIILGTITGEIVPAGILASFYLAGLAGAFVYMVAMYRVFTLTWDRMDKLEREIIAVNQRIAA